mmetsp:Transcript_5110/g.15583  ORF Transcript_5110/g.15583 Transcript_5110/m.15583 type:complete len:171 (-) Transcript_5110:1736-2248(-)
MVARRDSSSSLASHPAAPGGPRVTPIGSLAAPSLVIHVAALGRSCSPASHSAARSASCLLLSNAAALGAPPRALLSPLGNTSLEGEPAVWNDEASGVEEDGEGERVERERWRAGSRRHRTPRLLRRRLRGTAPTFALGDSRSMTSTRRSLIASRAAHLRLRIVAGNAGSQ